MGEDDLYDLADDPPARPHVQAPRQSLPAATKSTGAVEYRRPDTPGADWQERYFPDVAKDLYLPLGLIAGGTVVRVGFFIYMRGGDIAGARQTLAGLGIEMIILTAVMLIAILVAGKLRGINFGPLPVAVMKLCAVAIAPPAVGILLGPLFLFIPLIGGLGRGILEFATAFALLGAMFDLDQSDTWYCICIMLVVGIAGYFGMRLLI